MHSWFGTRAGNPNKDAATSDPVSQRNMHSHSHLVCSAELLSAKRGLMRIKAPVSAALRSAHDRWCSALAVVRKRKKVNLSNPLATIL
jgi:hypothetical protein